MKSQTISLFIVALPSRVYAYHRTHENLPLWVPLFCKSVEFINGEWEVRSPTARPLFQFASSNNLGVLD